MMRRDPPLRLLVVEDDADSAEELAELLECHGVIVQVAATAEQALARAAAFGPDLALVDLQLGDSSGADLAARWIAAAGPPRVILLSGRGLTLPEQERFAAVAPPGALPPLLAKPLDIRALVALVRPSEPDQAAIAADPAPNLPVRAPEPRASRTAAPARPGTPARRR